MSSFAFLHLGEATAPRVVGLSVTDDMLCLTGANGFEEQVAWWRLFRIGNSRATHRFRRVDRPNWELRVNAGADQNLLAHVKSGPFARIARPIQRLQALKVFVGMIALVMMLSESLPARWLASIMPEAAEERLVSGYIGMHARNRCHYPGGEAAFRKIITRLDPGLAATVELIGVNVGGFMMSAIPGNKIAFHRDALTAVESDAVAALIAHELSHLRHGDATTAMIRYEGNIGALFAVMEGEDRDDAYLTFSGAEEERADREAMATMRRAQIPMDAAASMFEEMRIARASNTGFAFEQRDFHFGISDRARRWQKEAALQPNDLPPMLSDEDADELYNYCWAGPLPVSTRPQPRQPPPPHTVK